MAAAIGLFVVVLVVLSPLHLSSTCWVGVVSGAGSAVRWGVLTSCPLLVHHVAVGSSLFSWAHGRGVCTEDGDGHLTALLWGPTYPHKRCGLDAGYVNGEDSGGVLAASCLATPVRLGWCGSSEDSSGVLTASFWGSTGGVTVQAVPIINAGIFVSFSSSSG
jgi:hypothetical protein